MDEELPALMTSPLTGKTYIVTKGRKRGEVWDAQEKVDVPPRAILDAVYGAGVRGEALDEVARVLGFSKRAGAVT